MFLKSLWVEITMAINRQEAWQIPLLTRIVSDCPGFPCRYVKTKNYIDIKYRSIFSSLSFHIFSKLTFKFLSIPVSLLYLHSLENQNKTHTNYFIYPPHSSLVLKQRSGLTVLARLDAMLVFGAKIVKDLPWFVNFYNPESFSSQSARWVGAQYIPLRVESIWIPRIRPVSIWSNIQERLHRCYHFLVL